jgi:predicted small lipoprotein YifL
MTTRMRFPVRLRRWWPALLVVALASAGCGKKGPLYLPDEPPARPAAPAPGK